MHLNSGMLKMKSQYCTSSNVSYLELRGIYELLSALNLKFIMHRNYICMKFIKIEQFMHRNSIFLDITILYFPDREILI